MTRWQLWLCIDDARPTAWLKIGTVHGYEALTKLLLILDQTTAIYRLEKAKS